MGEGVWKYGAIPREVIRTPGHTDTRFPFTELNIVRTTRVFSPTRTTIFPIVFKGHPSDYLNVGGQEVSVISAWLAWRGLI